MEMLSNRRDKPWYYQQNMMPAKMSIPTLHHHCSGTKLYKIVLYEPAQKNPSNNQQPIIYLPSVKSTHQQKLHATIIDRHSILNTTQTRKALHADTLSLDEHRAAATLYHHHHLINISSLHHLFPDASKNMSLHNQLLEEQRGTLWLRLEWLNQIQKNGCRHLLLPSVLNIFLVHASKIGLSDLTNDSKIIGTVTVIYPTI